MGGCNKFWVKHFSNITISYIAMISVQTATLYLILTASKAYIANVFDIKKDNLASIIID